MPEFLLAILAAACNMLAIRTRASIMKAREGSYMKNDLDVKAAAKVMSKLGASKGGKARAEALSREERQRIAREAVAARWAKRAKVGEGGSAVTLPKETHTGILKIGDREIPCSVLDNGLRVLSGPGLSRVMGSRKVGVNAGAWERTENFPQLPPFLTAANLKSFISNELMTILNSRIQYKSKRGPIVWGYEAALLPRICEAILDAHKAGALRPRQQYLVDTAEILMRGFAQVGIIALVDEATGYQEVRDRLALQEILDKFLRKEFAAWAKRFPDEFYEHIFRLRSWQWRGMKVSRPQIVAHYTKDLVYTRLAPGILKELETRNPMDKRGYRKSRHHQWLTEEVGHPALAQHLYAVIGLMRIADTWKEFIGMINKAYPKRGDNLQFDFLKEDGSEARRAPSRAPGLRSARPGT